MKYKEIVTLATKVKNKCEKNHKFPKKVKVNGKIYKYPEFAYYFAEFIRQGGKSVEDKKVKKQSHSNGQHIVESVSESDYKDQAKRICQFIKQNGRNPNNVSTVKSKKTVKVRDYLYAFAKIIVFYASHTRFPATCKYDSTIFNTKPTPKYAHSSKSGCDEMGQNTSYYCACHSLQEVLRKLTGIVVPQKTLAAVMGTTTSGTGHDGIRTAVAWFNKKYGFNIVMYERYFSDYSQTEIKEMIDSDIFDIIFHLAYKRIYGHYEVVNKISTAQNNWNVQNSLGNKCTGSCYCGYKEQRSYATEKAWINAKTGVKSLLIFKKG